MTTSELRKYCTQCCLFKPLSSFPTDNDKKLKKASQCKACKYTKTAKWRRQYPEKYREGYLYNRRQYKIRTQYNMSVEEFDALRDACEGLCSCCGGAPIRYLQADYDKEAQFLRGFLCEGCKRKMRTFSIDDARRLVASLEDERLLPLARYLIEAERRRQAGEGMTEESL